MLSLSISNNIVNILNSSLGNLPSPYFINYFWNIGSLLGLVIISQIISGILVSIFFISDTRLSFYSVIHLIRDVNRGWLFRFIHMNGSSIFFIFIYIHIGRGLIFKSFIYNKIVWISGIYILLLLIAISFLGYVLPWGQMSFWGATVITNIVSVIPYIGNIIVLWLWGGFSVGSPTLSRFFSLHFFLPFGLIILIFIHLIFLHNKGSSNPLYTISLEKTYFNLLYTVKDRISFFLLVLSFLFLIYLFPFLFFDRENYNEANPLSTPVHIQPEWYFLFAYAILRSIPNKLGGAIALVLSILFLLVPLLSSIKSLSSKNNIFEKLFVVSISSIFILLTWIGGNPVERPLLEIGQIFSLVYFSLFLFIK